MARKRCKPEEIVGLLRQEEVLHGQGKSMSGAIRELGISEVTYYRRRKEYVLTADSRNAPTGEQVPPVIASLRRPENVQCGIKHPTMTHRCRDCPKRRMFTLKTGTMMQGSPLGYLIHGLDGYPHGRSKRLEVWEGGVGYAEGVHRHKCPFGRVSLGLVDSRGCAVEELVAEIAYIGDVESEGRAKGFEAALLPAAVVPRRDNIVERLAHFPLHRHNSVPMGELHEGKQVGLAPTSRSP